MKKAFKRLLQRFGYQMVAQSSYDALVTSHEACAQDMAFLKGMAGDARSRCIDNLERSKSQLRQDLFVLSELDFKTDGYFVEFGATNGVDLSNTHLLETAFNWTGILAEPARMWHADLRKNRHAHISTDCVWRVSGEEMSFNETQIGEFSTLDDFSASDLHARRRRGGEKYPVATITLNDLLTQYEAPAVMDYLSIDTEGSELDILEVFDFDTHRFRVITVEHNYTPAREKIFDLLTRHGYVRKHEDLSKFDDWYVSTQ